MRKSKDVKDGSWVGDEGLLVPVPKNHQPQNTEVSDGPRLPSGPVRLAELRMYFSPGTTAVGLRVGTTYVTVRYFQIGSEGLRLSSP